MSEWLDMPGDSNSKDIIGEVKAADVKPQNTNLLPLSPVHASQPSLRPSPRRGHSHSKHVGYTNLAREVSAAANLSLCLHTPAQGCVHSKGFLFSKSSAPTSSKTI